jgi:NH3-dependent NAD+ synthetase
VRPLYYTTAGGQLLFGSEGKSLFAWPQVGHEIDLQALDQITTDTYSLPQSQEEFYFAVSYDRMDLCLYGKDHDAPAAEVAEACGMTATEVEKVCRLMDNMKKVARSLHAAPLFRHDPDNLLTDMLG